MPVVAAGLCCRFRTAKNDGGTLEYSMFTLGCAVVLIYK